MVVDIKKIIATIEKVLKKSKRDLELKGAPMVIFEAEDEVVWVLEDGDICVASWDGEEWVASDEDVTIDTLKLALFEYALEVNYDSLVRGKKDEDKD